MRCFTYGYADSYEVKISKQVAEKLGFPWFYVEYTKEKFSSIANSPIDEDYMYWAMNLNSTAHSQDFLAVKNRSLKVIPGMTAQVDIITGKRSPLEYIFSPITKTLQESFREK